MDKLFKYAGVTTKKGQVKVRFCNDLVRIKVLDKDGDKNITFIELPHEMDKPEIAKYLQTVEMYSLPENKEAIDNAVEKYCPTAVVKTKATKTTSTKTSKKTAAVDPATKMADLKTRAAKATTN